MTELAKMNGRTEVPDWLKWTMHFIDRVGFPVLAFLLMFYFSTVVIRENTRAINDLRSAMSNLGENNVNTGTR